METLRIRVTLPQDPYLSHSLDNPTRSVPLTILMALFGILALAFLAPISNNTALVGEADFINHIASIIQAKMALLEGQFPLRVAPLELHSWRYPLFQFYSPSAYFFTAEIYRYLTPHNPIMAYKIMVWLALVVGGLSMYRLCYWFTQHSTASLIASVAYLASPYYVIVLTRMDDLGESIALGLLPAVIYVTLQLFYQPQKYLYFIACALGWFLILTVHLISFVYSSCAVGLLLLLLTLKDVKHWQRIVYTACAYALGLMMGWWYLGPIAFLHDAIAVKTSFATIENLHPTLAELLFPSAIMHNSDSALASGIHPGFGWPILLALSFAVYAQFKGYKHTNPRTQTIVSALLVIFMLFGVFIWSPLHIWSHIPDTLRIGQYTWRLLDQSIWMGALLIAYAITLSMRMALNLKEIVISIFLIMVCVYPWFPTNTSPSVTLEQILKKPLMTFANDAYAIDFLHNARHVDLIDRMPLFSLVNFNILKFNEPYTLPPTLLSYAYRPYVSIKGSVASPHQHPHLQLLANNTVIAEQPITSKKFQGQFYLPKQLLQNAKSVNLSFALKEKRLAKDFKITIEELDLAGFLDSAKTLNPQQMQSHCQQKNTNTICDINVSKGIELLELPVLFYPNMLSVTLNGQSIPYQGVIYQNFLMAAIKPQPGVTNHVTVQFTGMASANRVSLVGWALWALLACIAIGQIVMGKYHLRRAN